MLDWFALLNYFIELPDSSLSSLQKFDPNILSPDVRQVLVDVLMAKKVDDGECQLWDGTIEKRDGYGVVKRKLPGCEKPLYMKAHRLAASLAWMENLGVGPKKNYHVSHLCHRK